MEHHLGTGFLYKRRWLPQEAGCMSGEVVFQLQLTTGSLRARNFQPMRPFQYTTEAGICTQQRHGHLDLQLCLGTY
jgi:hypothetical protein